MLVALAVSYGIDKVAYSSDEWMEACSFFDARTEVYDFVQIPEYEENKVFYDSIGLSKEKQQLLENYNFALEEDIDAACLESIVTHQKAQPSSDSDTMGIKDIFYECYYRMTHIVDAPYNFLIISLYLFVIILVIVLKDKIGIAQIISYLFAHFICWIYIIWRGRTPERITHGLYYVEIIVLLCLFMTFTKKVQEKKKAVIIATFTTMISAMLLIGACISIPKVTREYERRNEINKEWNVVTAYCKEHSDNLYLFDVYSTVQYSEKIFLNTDNTIKNYELSGGWTAKSPIYSEKLGYFSVDENEGNILLQNNVFFVAREERDIKWLEDYFDSIEIKVEIQKEATVNNSGKNFDIYQIVKE